MEKRMKFNLCNFIVSITSIILLFTVLSPCEKGMICNLTTNIVMGILGVIGVSNFVFIIKNNIVNIITAVIRFVLLGGIPLTILLNGGCRKMMMRCHTVTFPSIYVMLFILLIVNSLIFINELKLIKGQEQKCI